MAVLEKQTGNYYKVDFDECLIKGTGVYAAYAVYKDESERLKEKEREPKIKAFVTALHDRITALNSEILTAVEAMGKEPQDIVDDKGVILSSYPELRSKQKEILALSPVAMRVFERCYTYGDEVREEYIPDTALLSAYGYDNAWLESPIRLTAKALIYCGEYEGEQINQAFYYNRLKERRGETEDI
jgi:hypothetical protein